MIYLTLSNALLQRERTVEKHHIRGRTVVQKEKLNSDWRSHMNLIMGKLDCDFLSLIIT